MTIYLGADEGGYELKDKIKDWLDEKDWQYVDLGSFNLHKVTDVEIAREVAEKVLENDQSRGILFCGKGESMCQEAGGLPGIKAIFSQKASDFKAHDKNNVLCLPGSIKLAEAEKIVEEFLGTRR